MAPRIFRTLSITLMLLTLMLAMLPLGDVQALTGSTDLPTLESFVSQVKDGQADSLRGVYIPQILAARVIQQPEGHPEFVSPRANILTQFGMVSRYAATGLLAHNYLAGASFSLLKPGQAFYLVYGDGKTSTFVVKEVLSYQALDPKSVSSKFVDLKTNQQVSASDLMTRMYNRPGQVILQTCIEKNGSATWGRLFVIAGPAAAK